MKQIKQIFLEGEGPNLTFMLVSYDFFFCVCRGNKEAPIINLELILECRTNINIHAFFIRLFFFWFRFVFLVVGFTRTWFFCRGNHEVTLKRMSPELFCVYIHACFSFFVINFCIQDAVECQTNGSFIDTDR